MVFVSLRNILRYCFNMYHLDNRWEDTLSKPSHFRFLNNIHDEKNKNYSTVIRSISQASIITAMQFLDATKVLGHCRHRHQSLFFPHFLAFFSSIAAEQLELAKFNHATAAPCLSCYTADKFTTKNGHKW